MEDFSKYLRYSSPQVWQSYSAQKYENSAKSNYFFLKCSKKNLKIFNGPKTTWFLVLNFFTFWTLWMWMCVVLYSYERLNERHEEKSFPLISRLQKILLLTLEEKKPSALDPVLVKPIFSLYTCTIAAWEHSISTYLPT